MSLDIGATGDFPERQIRVIDVGRGQVGIVRWDADLYAVGNSCPHQGGPLCRGVLSGRIEAAEPGSLSLDSSTPLLACPWHGWEFDLRTGQAILDTKTRVRTFPVWEDDGRVLLEIGKAQPPTRSGIRQVTMGYDDANAHAS